MTLTLAESDRTAAGGDNALFALGVVAGRAVENPIADARRVTVEARSLPAGLEVFARPGAVVETWCDDQGKLAAYFWGLAGSLDVPRGELLPWVVRQATSPDPSALRNVSGIYIVLIDDRASGRIFVVSDVMGLRPFFVSQSGERFVGGSDIWGLVDAGLARGPVNADAVASWLRYAYDCTGQSLLANFPHVGFGAIGTWEHGAYSETPYATYAGADHTPPMDELLETLHGGVQRSFDAVSRDLGHVQVALSGGYDSRYLAALAVRRGDLKVEAFSVQDREAEGVAATMVATALKLPLKVLKTDGSLWNMFAEPFHFTAGGFPMTKQLSYYAASQRPGVPCLNGFIGDPMIRGTLDRADGKLERQTTEDLAVAFQKIHRLKHTHARFDLLDGDIVNHCDDRTLAVWRRQMGRWMHTGHPFVATSFFTRQRHYLANNFLQHMAVAEALTPFTAHQVIQYKLMNAPSCYTWETYEGLFKRFFPEIAHVPHNSKMGKQNDLRPTPSRCTKQWAAAALKGLMNSRCLPMLNRRKSVPRLIGALMGRRDLEAVAMFAYRLAMLDQRLRRAGIAFDWTEI